METLRLFLSSPLTRHPRLLGRKVAARLGFYHEGLPAPAPGRLTAVYPPCWAGALRQWVQEIPLHPPPYPFHRVFGHDLDEAMLLGLCREGPRLGERGLTADVKLAWEYSRGQPLFTNAAADPAHPAACAAFIRRWLEANADTTGPAWSCAMEIAIRALNWIFADTLFGGESGRQVGAQDWAGWLWRHGWLIWRRLESRLICSNHYLADLLGLLVIGTAFPDDAHGRRWRRFAQGEFPRALLAQTRRDGGLIEASLRYHAYVTEMALLFRLAQGVPFPHPVETRLRLMCRIVAELRDATGDVFPIGDDDSGRVLALDSASPAGVCPAVCSPGFSLSGMAEIEPDRLKPRPDRLKPGLQTGLQTGRAEILLRLASLLLEDKFESSGQAVCPDSGWWVRRAGDFAAALDFGGVGLHGAGAHAHNDALSFCLELARADGDRRSGHLLLHRRSGGAKPVPLDAGLQHPGGGWPGAKRPGG